jgi:hypothetical protein
MLPGVIDTYLGALGSLGGLRPGTRTAPGDCGASIRGMGTGPGSTGTTVGIGIGPGSVGSTVGIGIGVGTTPGRAQTPGPGTGSRGRGEALTQTPSGAPAR